MKNFNELLLALSEKQDEIFNYLKTHYPLFHNSIFFFRDLQFGIKGYFEKKKIKLSYSESEELSKAFAQKLINDKIFYPITEYSWKINNLKFITKNPGNPFKHI